MFSLEEGALSLLCTEYPVPKLLRSQKRMGTSTNYNKSNHDTKIISFTSSLKSQQNGVCTQRLACSQVIIGTNG